MKKLIQFSQNLFSNQFSDWSRSEKLASNFDRIGNHMLEKYNTCGAGKKRKSRDADNKYSKSPEGKVDNRVLSNLIPKVTRTSVVNF